MACPTSKKSKSRKDRLLLANDHYSICLKAGICTLFLPFYSNIKMPYFESIHRSLRLSRSHHRVSNSYLSLQWKVVETIWKCSLSSAAGGFSKFFLIHFQLICALLWNCRWTKCFKFTDLLDFIWSFIEFYVRKFGKCICDWELVGCPE